MPFLPPNQQCQSTEGINNKLQKSIYAADDNIQQKWGENLKIKKALDLETVQTSKKKKSQYSINNQNNLYSTLMWPNIYKQYHQ